MKHHIIAIGFAFVLAACSAGPDRTLSAVAERGAATPMPNTRSGADLPARTPKGEFASLPDLGDLLAYSPAPSRHEGRSIWHRAQVSEAHALHAVVAGNLRMTTPDGRIVDYRYQRHIEHPNGNWTWIGAIPGTPAGKAIITFGEHAAFGLFNRPNALPLELTVRDGLAWIVERDPRAMRGVDADEGPDFMLSPAAIKQAADSKQSIAMGSAQAIASGLPVVDVVLGYTSGFASAYGGQSQAVTRLTHLIEVTNDAYASSQLNAKVRLVRTVQVSYPDNTSNEIALNELTGSNGQTAVTTPASLFPLRNAREQYGADLVSLVRKFNDPENSGCGIAWLIGGGGTQFTTAEEFWGYSVVSDGSDGGFFCRTETLAHELGHNMGQNHNVEDSGGHTGVHPYSYGYRESSATGFFTIMAYRQGDTQYPIAYFANPNIVVDGRPTGVANTFDNVRSMVQTFPIVASFRSTVVPLPGRSSRDFNGDGISDILWHNSVDGRNAIWRSGSSATPQAVSAVATAWQVADIGDFNGDDVSDILWRNGSDGRNVIWRSGNSATPQAVSAVAMGWQVAGIGDFNGDSVSDILWRNSSDGRNVIWRSGNSATPQAVSAVAMSWKVAGIGDFNGDSVSDILWRNSGDGLNVIWRSGNSATPQTVSTVASQAWKVAGIGDFNGDGVSDILWRNSGDGRNTIWRSGNSGVPQAVATVASQAWQVAGIGDFNGDDVSDILWRNTSDGRNVIWRSGNAVTTQAVSTVNNQGWKIE